MDNWWEKLQSEPPATRPLRPVRRSRQAVWLAVVFVIVFAVTFSLDVFIMNTPNPYTGTTQGN